MQEVVKQTVEGLRAVNETMAKQQSIVCGLLVYWEKVLSDMETAIRDKEAAEASAAAPISVTPPAPAPLAPSDDKKWMRESFVGKDLVQEAQKIAPLPALTRDRLESMDPKTRADFFAASEQLNKATAGFTELYKAAHGRVEPTAEAAPTPSSQPTMEAPSFTPPSQQAEAVTALFIATVNQFLSPEISLAGRGFMQPKPNSPVRQYQEDILRTPSKTLGTWPTAFYRNADTRSQQLLISSNSLVIQFDKISADSQMELVDIIDVNTGNSVLSAAIISPSMKEVVNDTIRWSLSKLQEQV